MNCVQSHVLNVHLTVKTSEAPRCVCSVYTPAHHMYWLQLLTPTLNIASCHMHMSTVTPAVVQCYVTQCYHCIADGYPQQEDCIIYVYFQSYPIHLGKW